MIRKQDLDNVVAQINKILTDLDKRIAALEGAKATTPPRKKAS